MDVGVYSYPQGDSLLIDKIVNEFLSQGKFDKLRKECMSDADTKPAYQNLQQRVENTVSQFLKKQVWRPDLNKNQLRDSLRKHILESKFFDAGINRIVDQVVNPNLLATVFLPEVEEVVYNYLSIPRPSDRNQKKGVSDERSKPSSGKEYEYKTSQAHERPEKIGLEGPEGGGDQRRENHLGDDDYKLKDATNRKLPRDLELSHVSEAIKAEPEDRVEEKVKSEPQEQTIESQLPVEKIETPSDESQESLSRVGVEGLHISEPESAPAPAPAPGPGLPDSDDSVPLEINERSMSESRDSEDSIMNQMSPISQGRLTPDLEEECVQEKPEEKVEEKAEEKKPLTFIGRIPKIKREDSESSKSSKTKEDASRKEKLDVKSVYSSDESDSSKSYGKSDSDEKRRKSEKAGKEDRRRDDSEKKDRDRNSSSRDRKREKSKDRHKDRGRERSRDRHKKSSSSSSSSQRERSSSHRKSSHHHKESKSRRKEEEKKKNKSTDDHGKEKLKKEYRRSTDRDSNERERDRSSGSRMQGECRKREKEQQKAEEGKGESSQKEGEEMEQEEDVFLAEKDVGREGRHDEGRVMAEAKAPIPPSDSSDSAGASLDFNELFRSGALSRIEFAKLTDDFYVKFNSTGFRYFEEWEKAKLDCEEEFKEFVDEAENDLSLLSDDESELEFENKFGEENRRTIGNLLKGLGNFPRSLMLDPATSEFYRWTNSEFFDKFRRKTDKRERRRTEKESDESIKENIDRGEKTRALHLKLLNKYRRKAMRMGRPRKRQRRPGCWGIKEQNENRRVSRKKFFNGTSSAEPFFASGVSKLPGGNLVEPENTPVPDNVNSVNMFRDAVVTLPDSPEENEDWPDAEKGDHGGERNAADGKGTNLPKSIPLHLPPSPDSDDINNGITPKHMAVFRKRINKDIEAVETPKKQKRRNYSQKYDSQDLYKPRPILNSSRTRGKDRGLERDAVRDAVRLDSPISR